MGEMDDGSAAVIVHFWYPWHSLVRTTAEGEMDDGTCGCYRAFLVSVVLVREDYRGWEKWTMGRAAVIVYFWYPWYSFVRTTADGGNGRGDEGTCGRYRVFLISVVLVREDYRGWEKWTMGRAAVIVYFWYPWYSLQKRNHCVRYK
jgi:hypothetical protein